MYLAYHLKQPSRPLPLFLLRDAATSSRRPAAPIAPFHKRHLYHRQTPSFPSHISGPPLPPKAAARAHLETRRPFFLRPDILGHAWSWRSLASNTVMCSKPNADERHGSEGGSDRVLSAGAIQLTTQKGGRSRQQASGQAGKPDGDACAALSVVVLLARTDRPACRMRAARAKGAMLGGHWPRGRGANA